MPLSHLLGLSHALALGCVIKLGHSDVTSAHRVIPRDAVHRPCAIALPTSSSARPLESARASRRHHSIQGVGTVPRAFLAAMHAIARSNPHAEGKKCESLFARCAHKLHAHSSAIGSTSTVAGKLFQLRNHNDTGGRTVQVLPKETLVTGQVRRQKNYN